VPVIRPGRHPSFRGVILAIVASGNVHEIDVNEAQQITVISRRLPQMHASHNFVFHPRSSVFICG
jgi:hypothetical protein